MLAAKAEEESHKSDEVFSSELTNFGATDENFVLQFITQHIGLTSRLKT